MNSKPTLLIREDKTIFSNWFMEDHLAEYFNVEILDVNKCYDVNSTVVVVDWFDFYEGNTHDEMALRDRGIRLVIDKCWDCWDGHLDYAADYTLRPRDFIRWHESIWYTALGYNKSLVHNPTRDFLLLMNMRTGWRNNLYRKFYNLLPGNIYSYVGNEIPLQNAFDKPVDENWQRYINPDWYTSTRFSIVSESTVEDVSWLDRSRNWIHVSEKIYKPMAFEHAYIVWGQPGTLAEMHRLGFETFSHCIDESYDLDTNKDTRLDKLHTVAVDIINNKDIFKDQETQRVLKHNKEHFFNTHAVNELFQKQLVVPLLEFIES